MPRRPRALHRRPPRKTDASETHDRVKFSSTSAVSKDAQVDVSDSEGENTTDHNEESDEETDTEINHHAEGSSAISDNIEELEDVDAPRVAQWVDEEDLDGFTEDTEEESSEEDVHEQEPHDRLRISSLQNDLSSLPLGTLRKAQQNMILAQGDSDFDSEDSESESGQLSKQHPEGKDERKPEWTLKPKNELPKRSSKHAPTEVSSKRPVTRRRTVVEVNKMVPRDPRFLSLAGELDVSKFRQQYHFLSNMHATEMKTLRESLKRAKKLLASSPRDLQEERQREVSRLERAVKRLESDVNKDKQEEIEQIALTRLKKEEQEKRKQGKGSWYLKDSTKKELMTRARYDALASSGGKRAVKKAIEKKQKKISQREKKSRPFAPARGVESESGRESKGGKRPGMPRDHSREDRKRRRIG